MEHRCGQRIARQVRIRIGKGGRVNGIGRLANLSISGAWVVTPLELPMLSIVRCRVPLNDGPRATNLALSGCVVRASKGGFGIEWDERSADLVMANLDRLIPHSQQKQVEFGTSAYLADGNSVRAPA